MSINTAKACANGSIFHAMRDAVVMDMKKANANKKQATIPAVTKLISQRLDAEYNRRRSEKNKK